MSSGHKHFSGGQPADISLFYGLSPHSFDYSLPLNLLRFHWSILSLFPVTFRGFSKRKKHNKKSLLCFLLVVS